VRQSAAGPVIAAARLLVKVARPHKVGGYVLTNVTVGVGAVAVALTVSHPARIS
jgi:hypothetical protein